MAALSPYRGRVSANHNLPAGAAGTTEAADAAALVISECARFGACVQILARRLGETDADRDELQQAVMYVHAVLADLMAVVRPLHHQDLRRILHDRAVGRTRCAGGCRPRTPGERADADADAETALCAGCGGAACARCTYPVPLDGPALCWRCTDPGGEGQDGATRPPGREHRHGGDLPWVATA